MFVLFGRSIHFNLAKLKNLLCFPFVFAFYWGYADFQSLEAVLISKANRSGFDLQSLEAGLLFKAYKLV
jgi:hypothetical protein